jgi:hypothetical protein
MINAGVIGELPLASFRQIEGRASGAASGRISFQFTIMAASQPFVTAADDALPHLQFTGRLKKPLALNRGISSGGGYGQMSVAVGELELENSDGFFDDLIERHAIDGRRVVVKVGAVGSSYDTFKTIFDGQAQGWDVEDDVLRIALRDAGYKLQVPASATVYTGTGQLDGTTDLTGKRHPLAFGYVENITPPLVIPGELLYQVHAGPVQSILANYDRGSPLTLSADYSTVAALRAATVPAAGFATCKAQGYFRLGSLPVGTVTADVQGDATTGVYASSTVAIIRRLLARSTSIVDPSGLVEHSFAALDAAQPAEVGYYLPPDSSETVRQVFNNLLGGIGGWGDFRRDGRFFVGRLEAPEEGRATAAYTKTHILDIKRDRLPQALSPPPWRHRVTWGRAWTQQTDLSAIVNQDRVAYLAQAFRAAASADTALGARLKAAYLLAQDPEPVQAYFRREVDAQGEADRLLALYSPARSVYRITLKLQPLIHEVGDVVRVSYPRWDLHHGRLLRITDIAEDLNGRQIQLEAFG